MGAWTLQGLRSLVAPSVVACAPGMTPVDALPPAGTPASAGAAAEAAAMAAAQQRRDEGFPIGTEVGAGLDGAAQLEAEQKKFAELQGGAAAVAAAAPGGRANPGPYERAEQEAKSVLNPEVYDGFRMLVRKPFGPRFESSHEFWLGSSVAQTETGNQYHFGVTAVPVDSTTLTARLDPTGVVEAQWIQQVGAGLTSKLVTVASPDPRKSVVQAEFEYKGADFTSVLNIVQGPRVGFSYFQAVTQNLALGGDAVYQHASGAAHISAKAKYDDGKNVAVASLSSANVLSTNFMRRVDERISLATELDVNLNTNESAMQLAWAFQLRQARVSGSVSPADGFLMAQVTQMIDPGFALHFNAILNHDKDQHRFGYGVIIG